MKWRRVLLLLLLTAGLLALLLVVSARGKGYASPAECLDAFSEASKSGDVRRYLGCLGEPLRSEKQRAADAGHLEESMRQQMDGVKSWTQLDPVIQGSKASVEVDSVRTTGMRRTRYYLEQTGRGWLIVAIEAGPEVPSSIPYGTHIKDVPERPAPPPEP